MERAGRRGTVAVGVGVLAVVLVPAVIDAAVSSDAPIEPGQVFRIGDFRYTPDPRWEQDRGRTGTDHSTVVNDGMTLRLHVQRGVDSAERLYRLAERRHERTTANRVSGDPRPFTTRSGLPGLRGSIVGPSTRGQLAVVFSDGQGVVATLSGPPGANHRTEVEAARMVESVATE